jgi:hypothetical protein
LVGVLQTGLEGFDAGLAKLYPDAHGCILLVEGFEKYVLRYTRLLMEASPKFPIYFLKVYSCQKKSARCHWAMSSAAIAMR